MQPHTPTTTVLSPVAESDRTVALPSGAVVDRIRIGMTADVENRIGTTTIDTPIYTTAAPTHPSSLSSPNSSSKPSPMDATIDTPMDATSPIVTTAAPTHPSSLSSPNSPANPSHPALSAPPPRRRKKKKKKAPTRRSARIAHLARAQQNGTNTPPRAWQPFEVAGVRRSRRIAGHAPEPVFALGLFPPKPPCPVRRKKKVKKKGIVPDAWKQMGISRLKYEANKLAFAKLTKYKERRAARKIQSAFRAFRASQGNPEVVEEEDTMSIGDDYSYVDVSTSVDEHSAALKIQNFMVCKLNSDHCAWKRHPQRRAWKEAWDSYYPLLLECRRNDARFGAALMIQCMVRRKLALRRLEERKHATIILQSAARRFLGKLKPKSFSQTISMHIETVVDKFVSLPSALVASFLYGFGFGNLDLERDQWDRWASLATSMDDVPEISDQDETEEEDQGATVEETMFETMLGYALVFAVVYHSGLMLAVWLRLLVDNNWDLPAAFQAFRALLVVAFQAFRAA